MRLSRNAMRRVSPDAALLFCLAAAQVLFVAWMLGPRPNDTQLLALLVGVPASAVLLAGLARRTGSHCMHSTVWMVMLASFGLLVGLRLDAGPMGLSALAGWCSWTTGFSLAGIWIKVVAMPWSFAGMLLGGNLGMLISDRLEGRVHLDCINNGVRYLLCNAGMLAGMYFTEALMPAVQGRPLAGLAVMMAGMSAGMLLIWQIAERLYAHRANLGIRLRRAQAGRAL